MSGRYIIVTFSLICVGFSLDCPSRQIFAPCSEPPTKTVEVQRGENVFLSLTFIEPSRQLQNIEFVWEDNERKHNFCLCTWGCCCNEYEKKLQMNVIIFNISGHTYYNIEIGIMNIEETDQGIYILRKVEMHQNCTILNVDITLLESRPVCSTFLSKKNVDFVELSCQWLPRDCREVVKLIAGNETLQRYTNNGMITSNNVNHSIWNTITTMLHLRDLSRDEKVPDTCSTTKSEHENKCHFSVFMSPKSK